MGNISTIGGTGGAGSDDCTATLDHVLAGKSAVTKDSNDEPGTGRMTVNSLLSFNCAAYSGRRVLAKWQNPKAAAGKPYSGVYIRYGTGGYPGKTGGAQIYKGAGNNTSSGGQSQAYLDLPALNTTYYLSIYPYVTCSAGEMTGDVRNATVRTSAELNVTIKGTQNYTVPAGYTKMDIFCVGGGGGGGRGAGSRADFYGRGGGGGGGGYTATAADVAVAAGQVLNCTVGGGGAGSGSTESGNTGGLSRVLRSGSTLCTGGGGEGGHFGDREYGGSGGSGGGAAGYDDYDGYGYHGGNGGSNGGNGGGSHYAGGGQGSTTKAFREASGTLYSGGGGGGGAGGSVGIHGPGGPGGGGNGGNNGNGGNGGTNTGGGGGGGYGDNFSQYTGGTGGSGVIIIRLK